MAIANRLHPGALPVVSALDAIAQGPRISSSHIASLCCTRAGENTASKALTACKGTNNVGEESLYRQT
eukprot:3606160-Pleurochrysis_carterae.AAC.3